MSRIFRVLIIAATLMVGCSHESGIVPDDPPLKEDPRWEKAYRKLVDNYEKEAVLQSVIDGADSLHFIFAGKGNSVAMPHGCGIISENSQEHEVKKVSVDDEGMIMVGNTALEVRLDKDLTDHDAIPVYISWDMTHVSVYASNGHRLSFSRDGVNQAGIPVVRLTTDSGLPIRSKSEYVGGLFELEETGSWFEPLSMRMEVRGRGNSSWDMFDKKPYKIKLEEKAGLCGMHADRQWCLIANYSDKTLLRNSLAMEMSRIVGFDWTPGIAHVELYINGAYRGIYDLMENRRVCGHRVDIDIENGDCYLEIGENLDEPVWWFTSAYSLPMEFKDPQLPDDELYNKTVGFFESFVKALSGSDFKDPDKGYAAYIDVDSFIRYFIVEEGAKDWDGDFRRSVFFTLKKDGKLSIPHVWDFDIAFGNCFDGDLGDPLSPEGWYIRNFYHRDGGQDQGPMFRLFQDPAFRTRARKLWDKAYPELRRLPDFIDGQVAQLGSAVDRNFKQWPILGRYVWPNPIVFPTYEEEIDYLKDYISKRIDWIDANL